MRTQEKTFLLHPDIGSRRSWGCAHSKHLKKGISFKESCKICNPAFQYPSNEGETAQRKPYESQALPDIPAFASPQRGDEIDFAKLWRLAERRRPLKEICELLNRPEVFIREKVQEKFGFTWEVLSQRAPVELHNDLIDCVYRKARAGDIRFVLILEKWGLLDGSADTRRSVEGPVVGLSDDLRSVSTEELAARIQRLTGKYLNVVARPARFSENGNLSATLTVRDAEPDEGLTEAPWVPLPEDAAPVGMHAETEALNTSFLEEQKLSVPEGAKPEAAPPRGDAIARPQAGVLTL